MSDMGWEVMRAALLSMEIVATTAMREEQSLDFTYGMVKDRYPWLTRDDIRRWRDDDDRIVRSDT